MQEFTRTWNNAFNRNTEDIKCDFALEIGCFEGLTTCFICDYLLNPGGRVICIDPLQDEYLTENIDEEAKKINMEFNMFKGQYDRFIHNTKNKPVELKRITSSQAFADPDFYAYKFDFIYIDGDHRKVPVYEDACRCWEVLQPKGHILFDDYQYKPETASGIDKFLRNYSGQFDVVLSGYQIMIKRHG